MRRRRGFRKREEGVALLLVLVALLLLAALMAEVAQTSKTQTQLGRSTMHAFLLRSATEGRVQILRRALAWDASQSSRIDTEAEDWSWHGRETLGNWGERATTYEESDDEEAVAYTNVDVQLMAWCEDERSKLNLLGLSRPADTPEHRFTRETLIRLIDEFREDWSSLDLGESDGQEMVEDLVEWLSERDADDENPMPDVPSGRGRLQSVDDLLRVSGGKWTREILYDVLDPDLEFGESEDIDDDSGDTDWARSNGVPGLMNYLTVFAESQQNAPLRININTVQAPVLRALFDERDAELAEAIIEYRREGADAEDSADEGQPPADDEPGFFENKNDLVRVEGFGDAVDTYPRLNFFADVSSSVFSLRVVATMVTGSTEDFDDDDEEGTKDIVSSYQYREVVQRTEEGLLTLFTERRHDPIFDL